MNEPDFNWTNFYNNIAGREPRELLMNVLDRFDGEHTRHAIDLGCGDGTETAFLLAKGWHVLAIDSEPSAFTHLKAKLPAEAEGRLQTQVAKFEGVELSPADLIYAGYSLPFCHPHYFDALWAKVVNNVKPGGRFAGQLFGVNDTWASHNDMTFFTRAQAENLFSGFAVEYLQEEDADGRSTAGPKHWHVFHVIARKS